MYPEPLFADVAPFLAILVAMKFVAIAGCAFGFTYLLPKVTRAMVDQAQSKEFFWHFLRGILLVAAAFCAFGFFASSLIGLGLGIVLLILLYVSYVLATGPAVVLIGYWIVSRLDDQKTTPIDWRSALLGSFLALICALMPVLGWLFLFVITTVMVGVGVYFFEKEIWRKQK